MHPFPCGASLHRSDTCSPLLKSYRVRLMDRYPWDLQSSRSAQGTMKGGSYESVFVYMPKCIFLPVKKIRGYPLVIKEAHSPGMFKKPLGSNLFSPFYHTVHTSCQYLPLSTAIALPCSPLVFHHPQCCQSDLLRTSTRYHIQLYPVTYLTVC